ncbi:MAG: hypothetical protein LBV60_08575 [Streptomyces sp.]|nr:hypothetical protein [Streptomyces sp.]
MIPTLLAAACTTVGVVAGICIGAALTLPRRTRHAVQRAWTSQVPSHRKEFQ